MPRKKKSVQYNYFLDYVREAAFARVPLKSLIERSIRAYKQEASRNSYKENAEKWRQSIASSGNYTAAQLECAKAVCAAIPESTNDTVFNAIETFVSMAMGGASQFEYAPADEYLEKDAGLVERLSALAQYFHDDNKIDSLAAQVARNMGTQGQACFFLKPIEDGRFKVSLIDAHKKLDDPRQSKTNRKRYEGFTEIVSWAELKADIYKSDLGYQVSIINDVDSYITELQGWGMHNGGMWENELRQDLDTFRSIYGQTYASASNAVDAKGEKVNPATEPGYKGDDVEAAYMWDTIQNVYALIINRRFIVQVKEHPFRKGVKVPYVDSQGVEKQRTMYVEIDSPMVTIPFLRLTHETFPVSPLHYCLDDFDAICSMESVMNHNFSIMAPITFQGSSYDSEIMMGLGQVAGQVAEGTMNTFAVMNKSHDMGPIIAAIERRERRIKRMLGATDQFELQAMIGNRATASEVTAMSGAVSQRMNSPLSNIECGMSELIQKMFAMYIIFGEQDEFAFPYNGVVSSATKVDMLGRAIIRAKLKSQIKIQQQEQSRNALMVLQSVLPLPGVNQEAVVSTLVPVITQGVISRKQSEAFVAAPPIDPMAMQGAMDEAAAIRAAQPGAPAVDQASIENMSPEEMEQLAGAATAAMGQSGAPGGPMVDTGVMNDQAGIEANQVMGMI